MWKEEKQKELWRYIVVEWGCEESITAKESGFSKDVRK